MINERIFGSPISGQVRKKLEDRQRVAGEVAFGDSIEAVYPDKDGQNQADLSSRTPFVRMWTSVKLIESAKVAEFLEELGDADYSVDFPVEIMKYQPKLDEIRKTFPEARIVDIDGKIYAKAGEDAREAVDYSSKLYIVGDYNYQTGYGELTPNEIVGTDGYTFTEDSGIYEIIPTELEKNPLENNGIYYKHDEDNILRGYAMIIGPENIM